MPTTENTITIAYTDDILVSANLSHSELADITRLAGAAKLFEDGRLTLGRLPNCMGRPGWSSWLPLSIMVIHA